MPVISSFFISTTPRTGSSLLSEALEFTGISGKPREYFEAEYEKDWSARLGISGHSDYIEKLMAAGMTPNGVFGAKVHWHQFVHLHAKLRSILGGDLSEVDRLRRTFPDLKYIFLTRRDKVEQAVSYFRAQRTDVWHVVRPDALAVERAAAASVTFDPERIDHWVRQFAADEESWCRFFEATEIEPFEVVYEEFLANYESTVREILSYLNIAAPADLSVLPPRLNKLADQVSHDWVSRYQELRRPVRRATGTANVSYFISTAPRTGGFLLAEALQSTGIAGRPREYFDPVIERKWIERQPVRPATPYFETAIAEGMSSNGVFGAKVLWHQFAYLMTKPRLIEGTSASGAELLRRTFPDLRYVFLTRRDKIRQAISYDRAIRSGLWWSIAATADGNGQPQGLPSFDFEQIDEWVTRLCQFESCWRRQFKRMGVEPFEIAYEDLVAGYDSVVREILRFLDLRFSEDQNLAPPRLQRQADEVTEEWVDRYKGIKGLS